MRRKISLRRSGAAPNLWLVVLVVAWGVLTLPYVDAGAKDLEEYFTSVTATKVAMDALFDGAWPFWNLDLGLGVPQPLRFHFITHPLSALCAITECHPLLRAIASLHVLLGAICVALLAVRFTGCRSLALAAGLSYCFSSSVVQPLFRDDWPITALNESALPVLLYAVLAMAEARDSRHALLWALVLGGFSGLLLSMSFPVVTLIVIAAVALTAPRLRERLPWLMLAAGITLLMGAGQLFHIWNELALTPPDVGRTDHRDFPASAHLWSAFLRPLPVSGATGTWRTVFFGPPFAFAALASAVTLRDRGQRPLIAGLLLGVLGFLLPPAWLFNINTAQWTYRTELNVFGILLAANGIHRWISAPGRGKWLAPVLALQIGWAASACAGPWYSVFSDSIKLVRAGAAPAGVADAIAALYARTPGRVMFGAEAQRQLRKPAFLDFGLAPNQLQYLGVPSLSAVTYGITTDALRPLAGILEGEIRVDAAAVRSRDFADVLGVRYVLALPEDTVAPDLRKIHRLPGDLQLYENPDAWPEAFFVEALPAGRVPRLPGCPHDRFLCADFSRYDLRRRAERLVITRLRDGLRLEFPPSDSVRHIVITQWHRPGWTITEGRASLAVAAEQFIGVRVEPGERMVAVRFRPRWRALLFATTLTTEIAVAAAIIVLARMSRRQRWMGADLPQV